MNPHGVVNPVCVKTPGARTNGGTFERMFRQPRDTMGYSERYTDNWHRILCWTRKNIKPQTLSIPLSALACSHLFQGVEHGHTPRVGAGDRALGQPENKGTVPGSRVLTVKKIPTLFSNLRYFFRKYCPKKKTAVYTVTFFKLNILDTVDLIFCQLIKYLLQAIWTSPVR